MGVRFGSMFGIMTWSLVAVAALGLLSETALDKQALADFEHERERASLAARAAERGWRELALPARPPELEPPSAATVPSVTLLFAEQPFRIPIESGELAGRAVSEARARTFFTTLEGELTRYPASLLRRAGVRQLLVCEGLLHAGRAISSLPNFEATVLFDVAADAEFARRLLHHEIFHFIDFADDSVLTEDAGWARLNHRFFSYGNGGRYEREPGSARFGSGGPGFLSGYSRAALEEDKAEVFAFWMTERQRTLEQAARDPVLRAKLDLLFMQLGAFAGDDARPLLDEPRAGALPQWR